MTFNLLEILSNLPSTGIYLARGYLPLSTLLRIKSLSERLRVFTTFSAKCAEQNKRACFPKQYIRHTVPGYARRLINTKIRYLDPLGVDRRYTCEYEVITPIFESFRVVMHHHKTKAITVLQNGLSDVVDKVDILWAPNCRPHTYLNQ